MATQNIVRGVTVIANSEKKNTIGETFKRQGLEINEGKLQLSKLSNLKKLKI